MMAWAEDGSYDGDVNKRSEQKWEQSSSSSTTVCGLPSGRGRLVVGDWFATDVLIVTRLSALLKMHDGAHI